MNQLFKFPSFHRRGGAGRCIMQLRAAPALFAMLDALKT
jgi:hypothetical protein